MILKEQNLNFFNFYTTKTYFSLKFYLNKNMNNSFFFKKNAQNLIIDRLLYVVYTVYYCNFESPTKVYELIK